MPYGMPHYGDVSTEDLAHMFFEMGVEDKARPPPADRGGPPDEGAARARDDFQQRAPGRHERGLLERGRVAPRRA